LREAAWIGRVVQETRRIMRPPYILKARLRRLDRFLGEINVVLVAVAIGLGVVDLAVLVAVDLPLAPPAIGSADAAHGAPGGSD
jgi:hypothetical protein